jgi:hypothetical protein
MTSAKSNIDSTRINLRSIRLLESQFSTSDQFLKNQVTPTRIDAQIGHETRVNPDSNFLGIRLNIKLNALDDNDQDLGLKAQYLIQFGYTIVNLKELVQTDAEELNIDPQLHTTIISISYSTARGIILERTQGSYFNGVLLPILNPSDIIKSKIEE